MKKIEKEKPKHKGWWSRWLDRLIKANKKNPPKCCGGKQ